jgi:hypothetical protein
MTPGRDGVCGMKASAVESMTSVRLAEISFVTAQALAEADESTEGSADREVVEARQCLTLARERLRLAAELPAWGVRPDDGPTPLGLVTVLGATAAAAGVVSFLCGDLFELPAAATAVAVLLSISATEWSGVKLLTRIGRAVRRRRAAAQWPGDDPGHAVMATGAPGALDGRALIDRARAAIGELAVDRLAAFPDLPRTGLGVVEASQRDVVLGHLRAADLALCMGHDALERWRKGRPG